MSSNKQCTKCGKLSPFMVFTSMQDRRCNSCFAKDKKLTRQIIRKLKAIPEIAPPLGYEFTAPLQVAKLFERPINRMVH